MFFFVSFVYGTELTSKQILLIYKKLDAEQDIHKKTKYLQMLILDAEEQRDKELEVQYRLELDQSLSVESAEIKRSNQFILAELYFLHPKSQISLGNLQKYY